MSPRRISLAWIVFSIALAAAGFTAKPASAAEKATDRAVDALIEVLGHPEAASERLDETNRAVNALTALGQDAVPKLIDAILGKNHTAALYGGLALNNMPVAQAHGPMKERWDRLGPSERWKVVPYFVRMDGAPYQFALDSLDEKDDGLRAQAWAFMIKHPQAQVLSPARDRYLKALAGEESPRLRWELLTDKVVFDAEKEADVLIELLRPDRWPAKGEARQPPPGATPSWWPDGRDLVVSVLGARKVKRSAPALVTVLAEKGPGKAYLGHLILPLLGEFGDTDSIPELKRVLATAPDDLDPARIMWGPQHLYGLAARSLWQLGDRSGRGVILEMLKSPKWFQRRFAAETLANFGDKTDIPALADALDDEDWGVLRATCRGLERITGVVNREPSASGPSEYDAPHWKAWLLKNPPK